MGGLGGARGEVLAGRSGGEAGGAQQHGGGDEPEVSGEHCRRDWVG